MTLPTEPMQDSRLRPYLKDVLAWHGYVRFLGLPTLQDHPDTPMQELFVPPLLAERSVSPDTPTETWPKGEPVLAALKETRRLVVLGDPGGGKSTLVNWLAWLLASGVEERVPEWLRGAIPLPLVLRELELGGVETFDGLLEAFLKRPVAAQLRGRQDLLRELLSEGRVLVLADGLDEVASGQRSSLTWATRDGFVKYPKSRWLITSRLIGFDHSIYQMGEDCDLWNIYAPIESQNAVLEVQFPIQQPGLENWVTIIWASIFHILPFDDDRIRAFAHNWYRLRSLKQTADSDAADFIAALFRDETTQRLARTPQILTLMALVFRVRAHLPDGRALLYDLITEAYLESIDRSRGLTRRKDPYPLREKRRWLARVGFEMQFRRTTLSPSEEVEDAKTLLAPPQPNPLPGGEGVIARSLPEFKSQNAGDRELLASKEEVRAWIAAAMQASGYPADAAYVDEYLDWVARRSGLLLPRGEDRYAFIHLSFQEYAAALYLVEHLTDADWVLAQRDGEAYPDGDPRITAVALRQWAADTRWQETLVFCFESFAHQPKDAKRLAGWLFGENCGDFVAKLAPSENPFELPPEAPRAELLARLLADPHSGLGPAERESVFDAIWQYLDKAERRFKDYLRNIEPKVLNRVLSAPQWAERFWSYVSNIRPASLNLSGAEPLNLRHLEKLTGLHSLCLNRTAVADVSAFSGFDGLQELSLNITSVKDLSPLSKLRRLKTLSLIGAPVSDLSPLAKLSSLQELSLSGSAVKDLSPLAGLDCLQEVFVEFTPVNDLSPLISLDNLRFLGIHSVKAPIPEALRRREGLKILGP